MQYTTAIIINNAMQSQIFRKVIQQQGGLARVFFIDLVKLIQVQLRNGQFLPFLVRSVGVGVDANGQKRLGSVPVHSRD